MESHMEQLTGTQVYGLIVLAFVGLYAIANLAGIVAKAARARIAENRKRALRAQAQPVFDWQEHGGVF